MKQKEATMVEFMPDSNNWEWWGVFIESTPQQGLEAYAEDMGVETYTITEQSDGLYLEGDAGESARAYRFTLLK